MILRLYGRGRCVPRGSEEYARYLESAFGGEEPAGARQIVIQEARCGPTTALIGQAVALVRATRTDPRIRRGASVRAAIAIADLATALNGEIEAATELALPTRIELADTRRTPMSEVLRDLRLLVEKKKPSGPPDQT